MKTYFKTCLHSLSILLFASGLALQTLQAQQFSVGGHLGMQMDTEEDFLAIGANALIDLNELPVLLSPAFTYFIQDRFTEFQIDLNVQYPMDLEGDPILEPFFSGGLAVEHFSVDEFSETKAGLNVGAGVNLKTTGNVDPYFQGQYTIINDFFNRYLFSLGIRVPIKSS